MFQPFADKSLSRLSAWILAIHAAVVAAAVVGLWVTRHHFFGSSYQYAVASLAVTYFAQIEVLMIVGALGSLAFWARVALLVSVITYALAWPFAWNGLIYNLQVSTPGSEPPAFNWSSVAIYAVSVLPGLAARAVVLCCCRLRVGSIRQACPLSPAWRGRLTLRELLVWTTAGAVVFGSGQVVEALSNATLGVSGFASALPQEVLLSAVSSLGLVVAVFGEKRRWLGVLAWMVVKCVEKESWVLFADFTPDANVLLSYLAEWGVHDFLSPVVVLATLWPLRRAGCRLTSLS